MKIAYKILFMTILLLGWQSRATAQQRCGTNEAWERILQENPEIRAIIENIENENKEFEKQLGPNNPQEITIPVVVHIVWNTPEQNVSDAQVHAQIAVLNEDFRRLNADAVLTPVVWQSIAADCKINFCLAKQTPSGQPTTGIERRQTLVPFFTHDDAVKFETSGGLNAWDRNSYLNLWVCNLSDGLLGYAQFPGGPAATDGVVIHYASFGYENGPAPYNLGRTSSHEIGHWLNLKHIWGESPSPSCSDGDFVLDTPNQLWSSSGCPEFPHLSCFNAPNGDMFPNYMDYTDDGCMNLFTKGQRTRMHNVLKNGGFRGVLRESHGCEVSAFACLPPGGLYADPVETTTALLNWQSNPLAVSYNLQWKEASALSWNTVNGLVATEYLLTNLIPGVLYEFRVSSNCSGDNSDYSPVATFTTDLDARCTENYEPNNSSATATVIQANSEISAQISTSTDQDWYQFSNSANAPNIKVDLTGLPADYDMKLYRGSILLGTSQNNGLSDEQIVRNTSVVADNYYVKVYGHSGAWDDSKCYDLRVSLSGIPWNEENNKPSNGRSEVPGRTGADGFIMMPNPTSDQVVLDVHTSLGEEVTATIFNTAGAALARQTVKTNGDSQIVFDVTNFPQGIYMVHVRATSLNGVQKLVKE